MNTTQKAMFSTADETAMHSGSNVTQSRPYLPPGQFHPLQFTDCGVMPPNGGMPVQMIPMMPFPYMAPNMTFQGFQPIPVFPQGFVSQAPIIPLTVNADPNNGLSTMVYYPQQPNNGAFIPCVQSPQGQIYPLEPQGQEDNSSASSELAISERSFHEKRSPPGFTDFKTEQAVEPIKKVVPNYASIAAKRSPPKPRVRKPVTIRPPRPVEKAAPTHEPKRRTQPPRLKGKKYGYRTKQNKIDIVYNALQSKYEERELLASKEEVLRGLDTIRIHVKKFKALQRIEEALEAIDLESRIVIKRVSIPLSMKNQFQKKGFLVYVMFTDEWMVPIAQQIFRQFDEFKKCDVAKQTKEEPGEPTVELASPAPIPIEGCVESQGSPPGVAPVPAKGFEAGFEPTWMHSESFGECGY